MADDGNKSRFYSGVQIHAPKTSRDLQRLDTSYSYFMRPPLWLVHHFFLMLNCHWSSRFVPNLSSSIGRQLGLKRLRDRTKSLIPHFPDNLFPTVIMELIIMYFLQPEDESFNPIQWFYTHLDSEDQIAVVLYHNTKLLKHS